MTESTSNPLSQDSQLGEIAVSAGLITPRQLEEAVRESGEAAKRGEALRISQVLTRHGWLTSTQIAQLLQELSERALPTDRYEILQELGRGGMAVVYKARDRKLGREVALKVLRREYARTPGLVNRMLREARAIALLSHPGVVRLHDISESETEPYLVMELLQGQTLDRALQALDWNLRDKIKILEQVARGVQAAHQHGIVHRDLKPGNVMVEPGGRAVVMDFGLAHVSASESRLTRTGALVGTPLYMAPEQVRGENNSITERTDVYALGVIMYEMLTGRTPVTGSVTDIYHKILAHEVPSPRSLNPRVPLDLETVCTRSMAKDPRDRYATAGELADDLARYLAGEAITARPISVWTRLVRRFARRKGAVAGAAAILVLAAGSAILFHALRAKQDELTGAQRDLIAQMTATSDACLDAAIELRRAGRVVEMGDYASRVERSCRMVTEQAPASPEPRFVWGRMLRVLMRFDEALVEQDAALALDPGHLAARFERGLLTLRRHEQRLQSLLEQWRRRESARVAGRRGEAALQPPALGTLEDDAARKLRRQAEEDLQKSGGPVAAGLIAWLHRRPEEARRSFEQAVAEGRRFEEPYEWLGRLEREEGRLDASEKWYSAGLEADRGYAPYREGRALTRYDRGERLLWSGEDPSKSYQDAIADFDEAVRIRPRHRPLRISRGRAHLSLGLYGELHARGPVDDYERAIQDFTEAVEGDREDVEALVLRGNTHLHLGSFRQGRGEDPSAIYNRAAEDLEAAARLKPDFDEAWLRLGAVFVRRGQLCLGRGEDPVAMYTEAIRKFDRAIRLNASSLEAWLGRGQAQATLGEALDAAGRDPVAAFQDGLKDLEEAVRLDDTSHEAWLRRGMVRISLGYHHHRHHRDPSGFYQAAIQDLKRSIELNPGRDETHLRLGVAQSNLGQYRVNALKLDSSELYAAAVASFDEAIRLNALSDENWLRRGVVTALQKKFEEALRFYDEAIRLNPERDETWMRKGIARILMAGGSTGLEQAKHYEEAVENLTMAISKNPGNGEAFDRRGHARMALGRLDAALEDFLKALESDPASKVHYDKDVADCRKRISLRKP